MKWLFYNIFFTIAYCLMLPKFILRMKKRGGYKANFGERFGRYTPDVATRLREKPRMWIHAVSVGEANLAGNLIAELRRLAPDESFVISTTSSTGRAVCEKLAAPDDVVIYFPLDFLPCVRRALNAIDAKALVLIESELWPNIIRALTRRRVPLFLANARISDKSAPFYRRLRFFFKDVFARFTFIFAQSQTDQERMIAAGAPPEKIKVMGSVKFDVPPLKPDALTRARDTLAAAGMDAEKHIVILGGSTWPGEEKALAAAYGRCHETVPDARLVIVPRHAERGDEIEAEFAASGIAVLRKSKMPDKLPSLPDEKKLPPTLLVDTTGELSALYDFARIVFIGKSFSPNRGAQNMIEPAALGKPVLIGPNSENFAAVMSLFRAADAIIEIKDNDQNDLDSRLLCLCQNPATRAEFGARAKTLVDSQRGAMAKTAEAIHFSDSKQI